MTLITGSDAEVFDAHGVRFRSYVRPSRGSGHLCAWRIDVPAGQEGAPHTPSVEEVICCIEGELAVTLDGTAHSLHPGDALYVPPGSEIRVDGGPDGGAALTTTLAGMYATMSDGSQFRPPWTQ